MRERDRERACEREKIRVATDAAHQQLVPIISIISRLSGASKIKQFNVRHWWCLGGASTVVFFTHGVAGVAPFAQPYVKYTNCFLFWESFWRLRNSSMSKAKNLH